jgi:hypothetical protein
LPPSKPDANADFKIKGWGKRRNSPALIYLIPNHKTPEKPYQKGITEQELEDAYTELTASGEFTREWFNQNLTACAEEGPCNFTTIGGIFEILGVAQYSDRGVYVKTK